jgi:hypothetical protein
MPISGAQHLILRAHRGHRERPRCLQAISGGQPRRRRRLRDRPRHSSRRRRAPIRPSSHADQPGGRCSCYSAGRCSSIGRAHSNCNFILSPSREQHAAMIIADCQRKSPLWSLIPAASFGRTPPSRPRASPRSRASVCGPRDGQRPASTSRASPPVPHAPFKIRPMTTPWVSTSKSSAFHSPEARPADARLRISGWD